MNEGKPTKAKWWSRPRAHGAGAETAGDHIGATANAAREENPEGDFELERPATATALVGPDTRIEPEADSDFQLARPAVETPLGAAPTSTAAAVVDTDGDFELERPTGTSAVRDAEVGANSPTGAGGSVAEPGSVSVEAEGGPTGGAGSSAGAASTASDTSGSSAAAASATTVVGVTAVADARPSGEQGALSAPDAPSERPKPLHDPDPYGTPPYGEPGPWAPAPPVQHPATAPASGTASAPMADVRPTTPAQGTAAPATAPQPTPAAPQAEAASYAEAPAPAAAAPFPDVSQSAATPHPDSSPPPGASYAYPSQPGPPPFGDSARTVPPPYAGGAQAGHPPHGASDQHPPGAYADPAQSPQAATHSSRGPWQNHDPWAGSGALQQNGAAVDDVARRHRRRGRTLLVGALLIAVVAGGVGGVVGTYLERNGGVGAIELPQTSDGVTGRAPDSVAGIAASALPSVVTLHVSGDSAQGTGTGFVLDERGHILTNNHVVDPAGADGDISVTFSGGETAKATIVGRDTGYDLAVVKVSGVSGLKPLPLGNSEEVRVGDPVVAIGAPFDLANTVTSGIISAKERPITAGGESGNVSDVSYVDALQTDAPINPGNSGGPLLDGKARVIGINSAIRSAGSGSESDGGQAGSIGLGFAIPINQGKRVAEELINTGKATHPVIGVTLDMDYSGDGARIGDGGDGGGSGVTSGGPADRAGMRSGDVITEVDGRRVHSGDELIVKVRAHRPGDRLELTLLRDGRERTVTLTLGSSGGD